MTKAIYHLSSNQRNHRAEIVYEYYVKLWLLCRAVKFYENNWNEGGGIAGSADIKIHEDAGNQTSVLPYGILTPYIKSTRHIRHVYARGWSPGISWVLCSSEFLAATSWDSTYLFNQFLQDWLHLCWSERGRYDPWGCLNPPESS